MGLNRSGFLERVTTPMRGATREYSIFSLDKSGLTTEKTDDNPASLNFETVEMDDGAFESQHRGSKIRTRTGIHLFIV